MGVLSGVAAAYERWREARQQRAVAAQLKQWSEERDWLASLLAAAQGTTTAPPVQQPRLGVQFAREERPLMSLGGVQLVEASRSVQQSQSGFVEFGINAPLSVKVHTQRGTSTSSEHAVPIDFGMVTVTTKRVFFRGPKHTRVWEFHDLVSVDAHPNLPVVYFHDRRKWKTSGLQYPREYRRLLVEYLEIALCIARGDKAAVVASLQQRLAAHVAQRPGVPGRGEPRPKASPSSTAGLPRRLGARVVDGALYALLLPIGMLSVFGYDTSSGTTQSSEAWGTFASVAVVALVEAAFVSRTTGTPGKRVLRCTVVDLRTGQPPAFPRSLLRSTVIAALCLTLVGPLIDLVFALADGGRSLHDRAAGTAVVPSSG